MSETQDKTYNVVIVGGGVSGTAFLYTLAKYTNVPNIALLEKHGGMGQVSSHAQNNSQTLHVGDIESNYPLEKVLQVKPAAMMVAHYANALEPAVRDSLILPVQKMLLAVGDKEVSTLEKRYSDLKALFPEITKLEGAALAAVEPAVMAGRKPGERVMAMYNPQGYAVNYGKLAESFVEQAKKIAGQRIDVFVNRPALKIEKGSDNLFHITTKQGLIKAECVVVDADAYTLGFAKAMGYGQEFSLIPIAGTFYFTKNMLAGKVYTMQEPRVPFAAVHGDPDIVVKDKTRWGPTSQFWPVLESRDLKTSGDYFASAGLGRLRTWFSFAKILTEWVRFKFLMKNLLYILPFVGKLFYTKNIQKIVPGVKFGDVTMAKGFGGMRLQRVDINRSELLLGEGKIIGDNIIFNMTPSPGASVCLYNAMRDTGQVMKFFGNKYNFDKNSLLKDLMPDNAGQHSPDVSAPQSYSS